MIPWLDIVYCVLFSVVLIFNIAGNSLVIHIITNERGMKTPTNYLLLNLAVADLLFGIFLAPEYIFLPIFHDSVPDGVLGDWLCKLFLSSNIAWAMSRASIFTVLCLSVERYFAVCRPHSFSQCFSPKIVKMLVVLSWIYAVVVSSPLFVYTNRLLRNIGHVTCIIKATEFVKCHSLFILIESICFILVMLFLLSKIVCSLWCKQTIQPTGEREITERKKKKKVTLCVVAVIVTFVVCWIPLNLNYVILTSTAGPFLHGTTLATSINAALDPYLFSFQSERFKVVVKKVLCCRKESS